MTHNKVIVVVGSSATSWEDAVRQVVHRLTRTVGQISHLDVVHQTAVVKEDKITEFRAIVQVSVEQEAEVEFAEHEVVAAAREAG